MTVSIIKAGIWDIVKMWAFKLFPTLEPNKVGWIALLKFIGFSAGVLKVIRYKTKHSPKEG